MTNRYTLLLPQTLYRDLLQQVRDELPNECCGLLAGTITEGVARATLRLPLVNAAEQPEVEYLSEPRSMLAADKAIRAAAQELVAIYHSHPTSAPVPSRKDCERSFYDSTMNLIISVNDGQPEVKAWWITNAGFEAGKWEFAEDSETLPTAT